MSPRCPPIRIGPTARSLAAACRRARRLALPLLLLPLLPQMGCSSSSTAGGAADLGAADLAFAPGPTLDPGIISLTAKGGLEAETHLAVARSGVVAAAWIALLPSGNSSNGYAFSLDDGASWSAPKALDSPSRQVSSDPVLATDAGNNFFLTWIGFKRAANGGATDMHVYVARALAGSTTFGETVQVSAPAPGDQFDKPWITVLRDGALLVTYARTSSGAILAARSTDFVTWDNQVIVEDNAFRNLVFPCQSVETGRVFAAYHAGGGIGLRWSDDGGTTWNDADKSAVVPPEDGQPAFDDPTCAAAGNEVWVSYGLSSDAFSTTRSANLTAIRIGHSGDGGKSFDGHFDAHDEGAGGLYLHPYLIRQLDGALDLVYYAGAADGDTAGSLRRARSIDGGQSFAPSVAIHQPLTYLGARDSARWLGDYLGVAWARSNLYVSFTSNHGTASHVAFYRTGAPPR